MKKYLQEIMRKLTEPIDISAADLLAEILKIEELLKRFEVSPSLRADWEGTNHFELTDQHGRLWLDVEDAFKRLPDGSLARKSGQRSRMVRSQVSRVLDMGSI